MQISDSVVMDASGLTRTKDGYLVGDAKVSRAGNVQHYRGSELGLTGSDADKTFGVYRDPDAVFDSASMMSLAGRPVTRNHPESGVTADNWKELTKGQVGGVIRKDGDHVIAPMAIMDAAAAAEVESGARSLSAGYTCELIKDEGSVDGVAYQFKQNNIRFNHVAYLPDNNPRAGNTRIGDNNPGEQPITQKEKVKMTDTLNTVVLGDKAVQVAIADAPAVEAFKASMAKQLQDADVAHKAALADKEKELATKDAEIDALKAKVLDDAAIDKRVQERADLIATAKAVADQDYSGLSVDQIRAKAVSTKLGDAAIKDKSVEYVNARFDILAEDSVKEPHRQVVAPNNTAPAGTPKAMQDAHNTYVSDLNAWRNKEAK